MRRCRTALILTALLALSARGADTAPATRTTDYSDPKKAVATFLSAVQAQDAAAIRDALLISDEHKDQVNTFLDLMSAMDNLQKAAKARFRPADADKYFGGSSADRMTARFENLDHADLQQAGDTATIDLPADPVNHISGGTIALKRIGAQWKLDADTVFGMTTASTAETAQRLALAARLTRLTKTITAEIKDGAFASASEAYQAYWTRAGQAAKELAPATTSPATSAATAATTTTTSAASAPANASRP